MAACAGLLLSGCEETAKFNPFKTLGLTGDAGASAPSRAPNAATLAERDVEAPEQFQVTDKGLWDGRPSLGGIWIAHPDVAEPQRVIIRNTENSKSVVGALFRRERANPGPVLQVSSDAAAALGMLAGAPAALNVIALRREAAPQPEPVTAPDPVDVSALDPAADSPAAATEASTDAASFPATAPLTKHFVQAGIFSKEENADSAAERLRAAGMAPTVLEQDAGGTPVWRVVAGPARDQSERDLLLQKIGALGFDDAYPVTN